MGSDPIDLTIYLYLLKIKIDELKTIKTSSGVRSPVEIMTNSACPTTCSTILLQSTSNEITPKKYQKNRTQKENPLKMVMASLEKTPITNL